MFAVALCTASFVLGFCMVRGVQDHLCLSEQSCYCFQTLEAVELAEIKRDLMHCVAVLGSFDVLQRVEDAAKRQGLAKKFSEIIGVVTIHQEEISNL